MIAPFPVFCLAMIASAALVGFLLVNSVLVYNSTRYMAVAPNLLWRDTDYVRRLPNLLKHLSDAGFTSPWPSRPTALAAYKFRRILRESLHGAVPDASRLIQQHLSLWAFVQLHREEMHQIIREEQIRRAREILAESLDANARARLVALLNECDDAELHAAGTASSAAKTVDTIEWLLRLRAFDVLLQEHGYHVSDEFSTLSLLDNADEEAIVNGLSHSPTH